jgi:hypothetical protein
MVLKTGMTSWLISIKTPFYAKAKQNSFLETPWFLKAHCKRTLMLIKGFLSERPNFGALFSWRKVCCESNHENWVLSFENPSQKHL